MCLLIAIVGVDPEYPILIGSNRDEMRARKAAPPGLFVGERMRILSPRDRLAGGTWIGVNEVGMFASLTNLAGVPRRDGAISRGSLPHLALDHGDLDAAVVAVAERVTRDLFDGFQLLVTDGREVRVLVHQGGEVETHEFLGGTIVLSNQHRLGELGIPGVEAAREVGLSAEERLERLRPPLLDEGSSSGHRILKRGGDYGTVSSSLIAIHRDDPRALIWHYAAGPPDVTEYRNYGNLSRRLVEE